MFNNAGFEGIRLALGGLPNFIQKLGAVRFALRDPWMIFGQYGLSHSKVLRELTNFVCEGFEVLDFLQLRKRSCVAGDLGGVIFEVLQLTWRVVGLEAFEKLFRLG